MEGHRAARISLALREELDELIGYEMSDPRVASVTITEVVLATDGKKAQVRISVPGPQCDGHLGGFNSPLAHQHERQEAAWQALPSAP